MAVSIQELIEKKEALEAAKKQKYDIETSIGSITIKVPTKSFVAEAMTLEGGQDEYIIYHSTVEPDLSDKKLQQAYKCVEPTDIIDALLKPGEVRAVALEIMRCAGYGKDAHAKLHEEAKN